MHVWCSPAWWGPHHRLGWRDGAARAGRDPRRCQQTNPGGQSGASSSRKNTGKIRKNTGKIRVGGARQYTAISVGTARCQDFRGGREGRVPRVSQEASCVDVSVACSNIDRAADPGDWTLLLSGQRTPGFLGDNQSSQWTPLTPPMGQELLSDSSRPGCPEYVLSGQKEALRTVPRANAPPDI